MKPYYANLVCNIGQKRAVSGALMQTVRGKYGARRVLKKQKKRKSTDKNSRMKKSSKRTPRPIKINAHLSVINGIKPLTQDDKVYLFKQAIKSINAMQFGINLSTSDFSTLCDMLNISLLLTEKDIGKEYLPDIYKAREAMQDAKQRFIKKNVLGFTASELKVVKFSLTIHQAQIDICTLAEFTNAFDDQEERIAKGNFYKREGDLNISERLAA